MGQHKDGQVSIGAYVDIELREYLDKLSEKRGFLTRSDAVRAIIREHKAIFSNEVDINKMLMPFDIESNGFIIIMRKGV